MKSRRLIVTNPPVWPTDNHFSGIGHYRIRRRPAGSDHAVIITSEMSEPGISAKSRQSAAMFAVDSLSVPATLLASTDEVIQ